MELSGCHAAVGLSVCLAIGLCSTPDISVIRESPWDQRVNLRDSRPVHLIARRPLSVVDMKTHLGPPT